MIVSGRRLILGLSLPLSLAAAHPLAQTLSPKPSAIQYVTVVATTSADTVQPGGSAILWADVTPKPNIHVYAAGANGFTPVALIVSGEGITAGKSKYPTAELLASPGSTSPVPVYRKPFRVVQPITISKAIKPGQVLNVAGAVNYESCDDRMCFPVMSIPVNWTMKVR